jgi:multidrug efflux pump subunit AcrA (membrane-fusion protein)
MFKVKAVNPCVLMLLFIGLLVGVVSCNKDGPAAKPEDVDYYTCTMHPSVRSQDPHGKCPICSMDLVPVLRKGAASTNEASNTVPAKIGEDDKPGEFTVPVGRQQQISVTYAAVEKQPFRHTVRAAGTVASEKQRNGPAFWVWAQFFQDELPMLKTGLPVVITTSSYPGERFNGKISAVEPLINEASRTGRVRVDVGNPDLKLWPGMYVDAELTMDMGEGVGVPVDAVLPTGLHNIVFIDKGGGKLEPRFVELGRKYGDFYEVKGGLKEGERVVTSANFLIDAEAKVQGALKSW